MIVSAELNVIGTHGTCLEGSAHSPKYNPHILPLEKRPVPLNSIYYMPSVDKVGVSNHIQIIPAHPTQTVYAAKFKTNNCNFSVINQKNRSR